MTINADCLHDVDGQPTEGKKPKIKFYYWEYDNCSQGYAIVDNFKAKGSRVVFQEECSQKRIRKQALRETKAKYENLGIEVKCKKLKIKAGITSINTETLPKRDSYSGDDGLNELFKMLHSGEENHTPKKEILSLTASILAGYCTRICCDSYSSYVSADDVRAPIVTVKYSDYAYDVLTSIIRSLAVDTALLADPYKTQKLRVKYRPIVPQSINEKEITDCAYLRLSGSFKRMIPQTRDTVLLVNSRFFSSSSLLDLQCRNRWVSLVFFDMPKKKALTTPIEIDGAALNHSDCNWDESCIQFIVQRYIVYLCKHSSEKKWESKITKYMSKIDKMIAVYNEQPNVERIQRTRKFQTVLQLLAIKLFMKSCVADGYLESADANQYLSDWYNMLLPGCCAVVNDKDWKEGQDADPQHQFETAIIKMLEDGYPQHFLIIPEDGLFDLNDPDDMSINYWGYLKNYESKKDGSFAALMFRREQLEGLLNQYCADYDGKKLIKQIRELGLAYVHKVDKARMAADASQAKPVSAVLLRIEKLDFLSQELREKLLKQVAEF